MGKECGDHIAIEHCDNSKHSSVVLRNHIIKGLACDNLGSFIDEVLKVSEAIEETALMRGTLWINKRMHEQHMLDFVSMKTVNASFRVKSTLSRLRKTL